MSVDVARSLSEESIATVKPRVLTEQQQKDLFKANFVPVVTWYRWFIFAFFLLNILTLSGASLSFSPVSEQIATAFGVDVLVVNMCSIVFTITQIPMSFVAILMFNKMPTDWVLRFGSFLLCFGAWVRILSK